VAEASSDAIRSLASVAPGEESFAITLQRVVDLAPEGITGCSMACITLLEPAGALTAAASSQVAARVDALEFERGVGPALDAYRDQTMMRIESTDTEVRWPEFCRSAAAAGIHSAITLPLAVHGDGIGTLSLYSTVEGGFSEAAERAGVVFALHASVTLQNARAYWLTDELRRNLLFALETRGVIDQAKGILMSREGITADQAFEVLRRASQRSNRKVHDIAEEIVHGVVRARRPRGTDTPSGAAGER
jgi:GAF domain-containing protein